jgi:hypothetical protein
VTAHALDRLRRWELLDVHQLNEHVPVNVNGGAVLGLDAIG